MAEEGCIGAKVEFCGIYGGPLFIIQRIEHSL